MEPTLEELKTIIASKSNRIEEITSELSKITESIESLSSTNPDESIEQILENAVAVATKRQELATKQEVLSKALTFTKQELTGLLNHQQELETLDCLRQLREAGERCNKTLELLKTQFREIKRIGAKLSTLPTPRAPLTYNYRANLPKLKIFETVLLVEEDLRSSLDSINWND
jgi:vacuolar-type H+-ATPase subunit E/Vma4